MKPRARAYTTWANIKSLCSNPAHPAYRYVGGRGITLHPAWAGSFAQFLEDVGEPPPGTTLKRLTREGNYEPGNVQWQAKQERKDGRALTRR